MKFLIIGTGGTGGCLGGYLAAKGNDVTFIARGKHLEAMEKNGLVIKTAHRGDITINPVNACIMDDYLAKGECPDVIFVCVKYYGLPSAIEFIKKIAVKDTLVIPILNVFGTGEVMQKELPNTTCLDGCIYVVSQIEAPGIIAQPMKILRVFYGFRPNQDDRLKDKASEVEKIMKDADIDAHFTDSIQPDALQKFSYVSPVGAAGLYFHAVSDDFQHEGPEREMFAGLIQEVQALGEGMGMKFEKNLVEIGLKLMDSMAPGTTTSMQRDVMGGGQSEFNGLVTRMVELGKQYNVPVPLYTKIHEWGIKNNIK